MTRPRATYRANGPATSCHQCGEASIYGFRVCTPDARPRVLCSACAAEVCDDPDEETMSQRTVWDWSDEHDAIDGVTS